MAGLRLISEDTWKDLAFPVGLVNHMKQLLEESTAHQNEEESLSFASTSENRYAGSINDMNSFMN